MILRCLGLGLLLGLGACAPCLGSRQAAIAKRDASAIKRALAEKGWSVVPATSGQGRGDLAQQQVTPAEHGWLWFGDAATLAWEGDADA
jgi:hypothetical protein